MDKDVDVSRGHEGAELDPAVYDALVQQYRSAHRHSQKLFAAEKYQRQAAYLHQRRNNALLDVLGLEAQDADAAFDVQPQRVRRIMQLQPQLAAQLAPLLALDRPETDLRTAYNVELAVAEMLPALASDERDALELNPQDTEMWTRRNLPHLVSSKFVPVKFHGQGAAKL